MSEVRFLSFEEAAATHLRGKSVAVVGSAPSCTRNDPGLVDSHDVVVRVNNFKLGTGQGKRVDVHYSFYGSSIKSSIDVLKAAGAKLCMCKCPDGKPIESEWHVRMNKPNGVDYTYIYRNRRNWWFCDTFIPTTEHFLQTFNLLGKHQPTTGFAAIQDVLAAGARAVYLTGFDFFSSGMHNVNEPWNEKNLDDPIRHRPDLEAEWIFANAHRFTFDAALMDLHAKYKRRARQQATSAQRETA